MNNVTYQKILNNSISGIALPLIIVNSISVVYTCLYMIFGFIFMIIDNLLYNTGISSFMEINLKTYTLGPGLAIGVIGLVIIFFSLLIFRTLLMFLNTIEKKVSTDYKVSEKITETIPEILEKIKKIYFYTYLLQKIGFIFFGFGQKKSLNILKIYLQNISKKQLYYLMNLKEDLKLRTDEEISVLNVGRHNLSKLHVGNASVFGNSNLQFTRLDHQIKQFEELQKVLVKI